MGTHRPSISSGVGWLHGIIGSATRAGWVKKSKAGSFRGGQVDGRTWVPVTGPVTDDGSDRGCHRLRLDPRDFQYCHVADMNSWFHTATLAKSRGSLVRIPLGVRDFELSTTLKATVAQPRPALETLVTRRERWGLLRNAPYVITTRFSH